jgi:predicted protein tyrosine phosphatase
MNPAMIPRKITGMKKIEGVPLMKSAVHWTILIPSLILLQRQRMIKKYNPAMPHKM